MVGRERRHVSAEAGGGGLDSWRALLSLVRAAGTDLSREAGRGGAAVTAAAVLRSLRRVLSYDWYFRMRLGSVVADRLMCY